MPLDLHFLVPGDLDTRTGGYGYDRAIISGLRARGWIVHVVSVPGAYPLPSDADRATAGRALAALPDDALVLAEVYAAGEQSIVAADGRALAHALRVLGKVEPVFVEDIAEMSTTISDVVRDGDVVITMGAGSISGVPAQLVQLARPAQGAA